jgi:hypothetical protein
MAPNINNNISATGKNQTSENDIGVEWPIGKETGDMEAIEMQAGANEKEPGTIIAIEKQFGDHSTLSRHYLKSALTSSGGLAVINPRLFSEQENTRQESFKNSLSKNSTEACPPLESRKYFFPFKKLPTELRQEIWKLELAAREPRIVKIYYDDKKKKTQIRSKTGVPVTLHVCSESREIGLQVYKKLVVNNYFTGTFVEWERDMIYINTEKCLLSIMALPEMISGAAELNQMCQRLALDERGMWSFVDEFKTKTHFPKLEELIKVLPPLMKLGERKKLDRQVFSFEKVVHNFPGSNNLQDGGEIAILQYFQRQKKPSLKNIGHRIAVPFPYLTRTQKAAKKEQAKRDAVCDGVMLAAYKRVHLPPLEFSKDYLRRQTSIRSD